jgi:hypothetical protein
MITEKRVSDLPPHEEGEPSQGSSAAALDLDLEKCAERDTRPATRSSTAVSAAGDEDRKPVLLTLHVDDPDREYHAVFG